MKERLLECEMLIAPSRFYAGLMSERLDIAPERIEVLANGINLEGYGKRPKDCLLYTSDAADE